MLLSVSVPKIVSLTLSVSDDTLLGWLAIISYSLTVVLVYLEPNMSSPSVVLISLASTSKLFAP